MRKRILIFWLALIMVGLGAPVFSQMNKRVVFRPRRLGTKIISLSRLQHTTVFFLQQGNDIVVRSSDGKELWQRKFDRSIRPVTSPNGFYLGVIIHDSRVDDLFEYQLLDQTGGLRYRYRVPLDQDDLLPIVQVSHRGETVIVRPEVNLLTLLDQNGRPVFDGTFTRNAAPGLEKTHAVAFSGDGRFLALAAMQRPATYDELAHRWKSGLPVLTLFRSDGIKLWERDLPGDYCQQVAISATGKWIAVTSYRFSRSDSMETFGRLYDRSGNLKAQDGFPFHEVQFSADETELLRHDRFQVQVVALSSGRTVFEKVFSSRKSGILAAGGDPNLHLILLVTGETVYLNRQYQIQNGRVYLIDVGAQIERSIPLQGTVTIPLKIGFDDECQKFLLQSETVLLDYDPMAK